PAPPRRRPRGRAGRAGRRRPDAAPGRRAAGQLRGGPAAGPGQRRRPAGQRRGRPRHGRRVPRRAGGLAASGPVDPRGARRPAAPAGFARGPPAGAGAVLDQCRLAALEQMSLAASRTLDPAELARIALDEMIRILAAERAYLVLAGGEQYGRDGAGTDLPPLA